MSDDDREGRARNIAATLTPTEALERARTIILAEADRLDARARGYREINNRAYANTFANRAIGMRDAARHITPKDNT